MNHCKAKWVAVQIHCLVGQKSSRNYEKIYTVIKSSVVKDGNDYDLYLSPSVARANKILISWYRKYVVSVVFKIVIYTMNETEKSIFFYVYIDILSAIITGNTTQTSNPRTIKTPIGFIMYVSYTLFFTKYFDDIFALRIFISTFAAWAGT